MCSENHAVTDNPLVTVIIASYNHARYIEASIMSVINQTYKNIELLVIDDGSKDDSPALLKRLQQQHGFYLRLQANQGLARTLNDAIAQAKGDLIVPLALTTSCLRTVSPPRWRICRASPRWEFAQPTSKPSTRTAR